MTSIDSADPAVRIFFPGQSPEKCLTCGAALPSQSGRGRPRKYCSPLCKRRFSGARTPRREKGDRRVLTCTGCGQSMPCVAKSLPQGKAMCRSCRRTRTEAAGLSAGPCPACGEPKSVGAVQCKSCSSLARRIRPNDDRRTTRRERERSAPGLTGTERTRLLRKWKRHGRRCAYCGVAPVATIDHVVPLVRGGTNYEGNLTPACKSCNSRKRWLFVVEMRAA